MNLDELRNEIDEIDSELVKLFKRRMTTVADVAEYKRERDLPVLDATRERKKLNSVAELAGEEFADYTEVLYSLLFELSRSYEGRLMGVERSLPTAITNAIETTPKLFPERATVACQGVEGAYSQLACEKIFKLPSLMFFQSFKGVFSAVDSGLCRYGVVPLENSTAGSVNAVYDLMQSYSFKIVKSIRLKIDHCLVVKKGVKLSDIRELYSHSQAISQCSEFIKTLKDVKVIPCENTAAAAKMVAEAGRTDIAALASRSCVELYGLDCLKSNVQNNENNYTRFICISKDLEIYPGADRTSVMMIVANRPGSLYKVLSRFYALGINLIKLESRPIPGRDFEFMFYFDLDSSVYSPRFMELIGELEGSCEEFGYLGSYSEVL